MLVENVSHVRHVNKRIDFEWGLGFGVCVLVVILRIYK
jgi:hypothetical protein